MIFNHSDPIVMLRAGSRLVHKPKRGPYRRINEFSRYRGHPRMQRHFVEGLAKVAADKAGETGPCSFACGMGYAVAFLHLITMPRLLRMAR